jgi:hypothetical protein
MPEISSAELQPGKPIEIKDATDRTLTINIDPNQPLPIGRHTFSLVVVDGEGNQSRPATHTVRVLDQEAPTAILTGPSEVSFGEAIRLSGEDSTDAGGSEIAGFIWTLLDQ